MKRIVATLLCLTSLGLLVAGNNDLWERATAIARENWNLVPGKTVTITETRNLKEDEETTKTEYVISHEPFENLVMNELISSTVDGVEQNRDEAMLQYAEPLKRDNTPKQEGMFFTEPGQGLSIELNGTEENINGFHCLAFDFAYETNHNNTTQLGTLWLDKQSGALIKKEFQVDKNPRFVTDMEITQYYHYDPATGEWYEEMVDTVINISAMGNELINYTKVIYSDYWRFGE